MFASSKKAVKDVVLSYCLHDQIYEEQSPM